MMEISIASIQTWVAQAATPLRILLIMSLGLAAQYLIQRWIPRFREMLANQQETREGAQRIRTLSRVLRYTLTVIVSVVTILLALGEVGISVAPLLGAAGVAGIAIGFGAQSLVKDYFTGFFLLLENQIRIGDVIEVAGKTGAVEELTLRYLRLRDYFGNVHFIPNGQISVVTNMSVGFAYAVMDLSVAYGTDIDRVTAIMRDVGNQLRAMPALTAKILSDLEIAGVEQWADSALIIRCRFQVAPNEQWTVRREYLRYIKSAFDDTGIEIPFPHLKIVTP